MNAAHCKRLSRNGEGAHRVTVVIPCYRDAATLGSAIGSLQAQSRKVDEIVVVNDCSPETAEIERVLADFPDVMYIKNPANLGVAASRNLGLNRASGDVVAFLDADDEYHPQKIALQLSQLTPGSIVTCGVKRFSTREQREAFENWREPIPVDVVSRVGTQILRNTLTGAALMAYREHLLRIGGYDETLRSGEDYDLWLRLLHAGAIVKMVKLPLYLYYVNDRGLSRNWLDISSWELEVLKRHEFRLGHKVIAEDFRWATIWAWWLLKHIARAEAVREPQVLDLALKNVRFLKQWPLHQRLITFAARSRMFRPVAWLRSQN